MGKSCRRARWVGGVDWFSPDMIRVGMIICCFTTVMTLLCLAPKGVEARKKARRTRAPQVVLPQSGDLRVDLDQMLGQAALRRTDCGVAILSLADGRLIYAHNADRALIPASNTKLFTTAVALSALGTGYTFNTYLYRRGEVDSAGCLKGDLVVRGTGDPTLSEAEQIRAWADSLRAKGISRVEGDVIGDATRPGGKTPRFSTGRLVFDQDRVEILVKPGAKVGDPATVSFASGTILPVENEARTIKRSVVTTRVKAKDSRGRTRYRRVRTYRGEALQATIESGRVIVSGSIAAGTKARRIQVPVKDSSSHFAAVVRAILEREGIPITGTARSCSDENSLYAGVDPLPLVTHHSAPLSELLKIINKKSHNAYAEYLLQTLEKDLECRGLLTPGEEPVEQFANLNAVGKCQLVDGSGLSHQNLVSPLAVVNLLKYVYDQPYFATYMNSLAVAGIDGTLARRMHNSPARGKVYAKTGTVSGVSALSGYAVTQDGKMYAFSFLANNLSSRSVVLQAEDHLCRLLVGFNGS